MLKKIWYNNNSNTVLEKYYSAKVNKQFNKWTLGKFLFSLQLLLERLIFPKYSNPQKELTESIGSVSTLNTFRKGIGTYLDADSIDNHFLLILQLTGSAVSFVMSLLRGGSVAIHKDSLDNQQLNLLTFSYSTLTIGLEDGDTLSVDISAISTDDQNLTKFTVDGDSLRIDIEGGASVYLDADSMIERALGRDEV